MPDFTDTQLERMKIPPQSIEAEQAVLGALMMDNLSYEVIGDRINRHNFYRADHGKIFEAIKYLAERNDPFDVITVADYLETEGNLDAVGGRSYLAGLAIDTPTAANAKAYANIVRERAVMRQLIHAGNDIANSGYTPEGRSATDLVAEAERIIFKIAEQDIAVDQGFRDIHDILIATQTRIETLIALQGQTTGIATGLTALDHMTSGLQRGDMIVIAGRPSMGKTSLAMNIVENVALNTQEPVAVFSLEMPSEQLTMRMISSNGRINQSNLRSGNLNQADFPRLVGAVGALNSTKLFIDDSSSLSPANMLARARRLQREHGQLALVMVDYLQLMKIQGSGDNRVAEVSEISRSLKQMARELNCPVLVLSQLNRSLEQRPNKRPIMSDLRESGAIEQDADVICFVYRDEVYNKEESNPNRGKAEIIIGKQRNGPIGTVHLKFTGEYTRFDNLALEEYEDVRQTSMRSGGQED
ncbi:replicative DNA helicase DnaB [Gammaproteobacteria bacterium]|nr:replicative DNA helicase DnaB [Gammaproteobacteria bacterium]